MLKFYSEMSNFYKKSWDFFPAYDLTLIPAGFEPATVRLEGECSIQLSYETLLIYLIKKSYLSQSSICDRVNLVELKMLYRFVLLRLISSVDEEVLISQN